MMSHVIRPLHHDDLDRLSDDLLDINKEELRAMHDMTVKELFLNYEGLIDASDVLVVEGDIIAVGGSADTVDGHLVWLMGTNKLKDHKGIFARVTFQRFKDLKKNNDLLYSYVFGKNELTKTWLKKLGFSILEGKPEGLSGEVFHRFEWRKECVQG